MTACANCGAEASDAYCPSCGQATGSGRLTLAHWLRDAADNLFSLEARLPRTLVGLTVDPGGTARAFVDGRRVAYVSPLRYAISTAALWILAHVAFSDPANEVTGFMVSWGQLLNLLLVPPIAAALHLAFLRTGTNYAEHLSLTLHLTGHVFLWRSGLVALGSVDGVSTIALNSIDSVLFLVYFSWGLWGFHRRTSRPLARAARILLGLFLISLVSSAVSLLAMGFAGVEPTGGG